MNSGEWTKQGELVVYQGLFQEPVRYNYKSIVQALANVKATRSIYHTEEAYQRQIAHLEEGLSLFGGSEGLVMYPKNHDTGFVKIKPN